MHDKNDVCVHHDSSSICVCVSHTPSSQGKTASSHSRVTHSYVTWLTHMWRDSFTCDMTNSYVTWLIHMRRASFIYVTWFVHMWYHSFIWNVLLSYMWHDSFMCDMTHSYETWLFHICDMTRSYVIWLICMRRDPFIYVTWHDSFIRDMTHSRETWLFHIKCHSIRTHTPSSEKTKSSSYSLVTRSYEMWLFPLWDMTHACQK